MSHCKRGRIWLLDVHRPTGVNMSHCKRGRIWLLDVHRPTGVNMSHCKRGRIWLLDVHRPTGVNMSHCKRGRIWLLDVHRPTGVNMSHCKRGRIWLLDVHRPTGVNMSHCKRGRIWLLDVHRPTGVNMSHCKRGRKPKSAFSSSGDTIEIERFCRIAFFPGTNITKWSLKKEWAEFSKLYFSSSRPKEKIIKNAYNFFKRDETKILSLVQRIKSGCDPSCELLPCQVSAASRIKSEL